MDCAKRKPIRLRNYDYSQNGCYFITICVQNMKNLLCRGDYKLPESTNQFQLSDIGEVVDLAISNIPKYYTYAIVDKYVIMPNHLHIIITLENHSSEEKQKTISTIIKELKSYITKHIGYSIWQKSYYDHIIRKESEYQDIWEYIDNNPLKWELDKYYNKHNT